MSTEVLTGVQTASTIREAELKAEKQKRKRQETSRGDQPEADKPKTREQKQAYQSGLRGKLGNAIDQLSEVAERVSEAERKIIETTRRNLGSCVYDQSASLIREIHTILQSREFERISDEEAERILRRARTLLIEEARSQEIFEAENQVQHALEAENLTDAIRAVGDIEVDNLEEIAIDLSPNFRGLNEDYVAGVQYWLRYSSLHIQADIAEDEGNDTRAGFFRRQAQDLDRPIGAEYWREARREIANLARRDIEVHRERIQAERERQQREAQEEARRQAEEEARGRELEQLDTIARLLRGEKIEAEDTEGWLTGVFEAITFAERDSLRKEKSHDEQGDPGYWDLIESSINDIPDDMGERLAPDPNNPLYVYFRREFPEGIPFRELLRRYFEARRNLSNRMVQIRRSNESLVRLGVKGEEIVEALAPPVQEFDPMDWYLIIHTDDIFEPYAEGLADEERKEILVNVDTALCEWWDIGVIYNNEDENNLFFVEQLWEDASNAKRRAIARRLRLGRRPNIGNLNEQQKGQLLNALKTHINDLGRLDRPDRRLDPRFRGAPTYKDSLNDAEAEARLRDLLARKLDGVRGGEDLAFRLFTVWMTMARFDREVESLRDKGEARALMYDDTRRVIHFCKRQAEPGGNWTIGGVFAFPPEYLDSFIGDTSTEKLKKRKEIVTINGQRAVFLIDPEKPDPQCVGDFLSLFFVVEDELTGSPIRRKLESWAVNPTTGRAIRGGWKKTPFYRSLPTAYEGLFTYHMNFADRIVKQLYTPPKREEFELFKDPGYWGSLFRLVNRLDAISPFLNTAEFDFRGELLRKLLNRVYQRRIRRNPQLKANIDQITGYSGRDDIAFLGAAEARRIEHVLKGEVWVPDSAVREVLLNRYQRRIAREKKTNRGFSQLEQNILGVNGYIDHDDLAFLGDAESRDVAEMLRNDRTVRDILGRDYERVTFAQKVEERSKAYIEYALQKIRMKVALSKLWEGSLDRQEAIIGLTDTSSINEMDFNDIISALVGANFLSEEYLRQVEYEVINEMGIGTRMWDWVSRRGKKKRRYRLDAQGRRYYVDRHGRPIYD